MVIVSMLIKVIWSAIASQTTTTLPLKFILKSGRWLEIFKNVLGRRIFSLIVKEIKKIRKIWLESMIFFARKCLDPMVNNKSALDFSSLSCMDSYKIYLKSENLVSIRNKKKGYETWKKQASIQKIRFVCLAQL